MKRIRVTQSQQRKGASGLRPEEESAKCGGRGRAPRWPLGSRKSLQKRQWWASKKAGPGKGQERFDDAPEEPRGRRSIEKINPEAGFPPKPFPFGARTPEP